MALNKLGRICGKMPRILDLFLCRCFEMNLEKIFYGSSTAARKKFLMGWLEGKKFSQLVFPGCGDFQMVMAGMKACGGRIIASDVSLYSDTIGHYIIGEEPPEFEIIAEIGFDINPKDPAEVLLLIKAIQLLSKGHWHYERFYNEIRSNFAGQRAHIRAHLEEYKNLLGGIQYRHRCMFAELDEFQDDPKTFIYLNPPVFGAYERKVFNTEGFIRYRSDFRQMDYNKDYPPLIEQINRAKAHIVYVLYRNKFDVPASHLIFAESRNIDRINYLGYNHRFRKSRFLDKSYLQYENFRNAIFTEGDTGTVDENSEVTIAVIKPQIALYLRDLFVHKMGAFEGVAAEKTVAFYVNHRLIGICGLNLSHLVKDRADYIFEVYAMSVHNSRYHFNNLIMRCITRLEFAKLVTRQYKNACMLRPKKIKTVCLTRFPKLKTSVGVLDLVEKEKINNIPTWKLTYEAKLKKDGLKAAYLEWLKAMRIKRHGKDS